MSGIQHTMIPVLIINVSLRVPTCFRAFFWCQFLVFSCIPKALWYSCHCLCTNLASDGLSNEKKNKNEIINHDSCCPYSRYMYMQLATTWTVCLETYFWKYCTVTDKYFISSQICRTLKKIIFAVFS